MHTEQRDLNDENLEPQRRAGAEVALDVRAGLAGCALVRVAGWADVLGVETGGVAAVEATLDFTILDTEHGEDADDVCADDFQGTAGCCGDGEEALEEGWLCFGRTARRSGVHFVSDVRFVFFWYIRSARTIPANTTVLHALSPALV